MAEQVVVFTNAELIGFSRDKKKAGEAKFSSSLTKALCEKMEWNEDLPGFLSGGSAGGSELLATSMTLKSKEGNLAEYETTIEISRVHSFEFVRKELEGKKGKGQRIELTFKVGFVDLTGCAYLEQYITAPGGKSKGTLTVKYSPKAEQMVIPASDNSRQGVLKED